jgi:opacity protein-like surface antigen
MRWTLGALVVAAGLVVAGVAGAGGSSRIERSGTVGLSGGGSYGVIKGDSRYGTGFDNGAGLNLGLRYVLGPRWSMGVSFQSQAYDGVPSDTLRKVQMTDISVDTYFYRDRQADASQYLVVGVGFYRPEIHASESEISFPGENLRLSVGVGAEIFFRENWGLELSGRVVGYFGDGLTDQERADLTFVKPSGDFAYALQGHVGILYYILR